ncbi:hypothetical protein M409DRAFT_17207 [Zasmidium cellare ATCC 36951]|uniref:Transcription factor domain-containing protein n=1 Tax=Zasmidium cellare ATCC 36951 TaxID=1080233 RepID=A0A6A6D1G0_ZASCE|nr:uncharacterized protein M409DRAFT_17207 [Zasmidium cellare ATCC 36951]KAF2173264.1 hypothetical protein M409DRAFT_17207 [Zasmidium cellare ATCC 36951]
MPRLSGKTVPVLDDSTSASSSRDSSSPHGDHFDDSLTSVQPSPSESGQNHTHTFACAESINGDLVLNNKFATGQDFSLQSLPSGINHFSAKGLLRYYDHIVAPMMTWYDGPDNEWRLIMIPLALRSPPLLLAILALTAEHYACKTGLAWPFPDGNTSATLREQSLKILAEHLRVEMANNNTAGNDGRVAEILGTTIVLCNLEMINSESELWRVHWKAVRTITRRWTTTSLMCHPVDTECRTLVAEAFFYDAMASSTTFDGGEPIPVEVIHPDDFGVHAELMQVMQEITQAERQRFMGNLGVRNTPLRDLVSLQARLHQCHVRDVELAKVMHFPFPSEELRADFITLIDFWHFACTLYGMQALMDPQQSRLHRKDYMYRGYECFKLFKNKRPFQQDVVWPLFIIGAEAKDHVDIQDFTQREIVELMDVTGWRNCTRALDFLKHFWANGSTTDGSWIDHARFQASHGFSFLLV